MATRHQQYGLTSDGQVTTERAEVATVGGHETLYSYDGKRWASHVYGPGGAEGVCDEADVPEAVRAAIRGEMRWRIEARRQGGEWSAEPIGRGNEFASEAEADAALDSWLENVDDGVPVEDGGWEYRVVERRA